MCAGLNLVFSSFFFLSRSSMLEQWSIVKCVHGIKCGPSTTHIFALTLQPLFFAAHVLFVKSKKKNTKTNEEKNGIAAAVNR